MMIDGRTLRIASAMFLFTSAFCVVARSQEDGTPPTDPPIMGRDMAVRRAEAFQRIKLLTQGGQSTRILVRLDVPNVAALTRTALAQKQAARGMNADAQLEAAIVTVADAELAKLTPNSYTVYRRYSSLPFLAMTVSGDALADLKSSPVVLEVQEDRLSKPTLENTVEFTGASTSWAQGLDGSGWYVAILDTGIRASHNFFAGKDIMEACFSANGSCPNGSNSQFGPGSAQIHATQPRSDHGTHVAGIATGNGPDIPAAGVAKGANLIAVQVFSQFINSEFCAPGGGDCVLSFTSDQIAAMNFVLGQRFSLDIASVNMSLGGGQFFSQLSCDVNNSFEKGAIDNLKSVGVATVIAAGNDGFCDSLSAPGCISSAVAVGATNDTDGEVGFSNFHAGMLDIYAPGLNVNSSEGNADNDYGNMSGTSMATPHVAGSWAILKQAAPNASVDSILAALQATGDSVSGRCVGTPTQPRIQIDAATALVRPSCIVDEIAALDAAADDRFASAVAVDGDVIVAGAALSDGAFSATGAAYVYRFDGTAWPQETKLTADVPVGGDEFGNSVGVSGDVVLVGAHRDDDGAGNAGAAYVFRFDGASWNQEQKLVAGDPGVNDFFGRSAAVDGDVAVIGAFVDDCPDATNDCGSAYVFRFDGAVWSEEQKLVASDATASDLFGVSVAVEGDVIVVGSQNADCPGGTCGAAYVFRHDGASWVEESKLVASDQATGDRFGISVSMTTDLIAVGASGADCVGGETNCGSSYVYTFDGAVWNSEAKLLAWDADEGDGFGGSVSVDGEVLIVGAKDADCSSAVTNCGTAYVFRFDGFDWNMEPNLSPAAPTADDQFGSIVARGGTVVVVGVSRRECGAGDDCGSADVFSMAGDCDLNGTVDACDIIANPDLDMNGDGLLDICDCDPTAAPQPDLRGIKNRFLSFTAGDPGRLSAVRVTFESLPVPYDLWDGAALWVGPTAQVSESGGSVVPQMGFPNFTAAVLQCEPFFTDWGLLGEVHVMHEGIVPSGTYRITVLDESCLSNLEENFSDPLVISNPIFGDTAADLGAVPPTPPDGDVSISDVLGVLGRFSSVPSAIIKSRADLEPGCIDLLVNISDALLAVSGFAGLPYPFAPSAADACDSTCISPLP